MDMIRTPLIVDLFYLVYNNSFCQKLFLNKAKKTNKRTNKTKQNKDLFLKTQNKPLVILL